MSSSASLLLRCTFALGCLLTLGCEPSPPPVGSVHAEPLPPTVKSAESIARGWVAEADSVLARTAPTLSLSLLSGDSLALSDLQGKVVVVNFWATWCAPCRQEMPILDAMARELGPRGLEVVGISIDEDGASSVAPYIEAQGYGYPIALDPMGVAAEAFGGVLSLPATFVIDREGMIANRTLGLFQEDVFRAMLRTYLAEDA